MLKNFSQLLRQIDFSLRKFFSADSHYQNRWQRQAEPASGLFGANRGNANRYRTGYVHPARIKKYTVEEVKRCLRGLEQGERVRPVMAEAAQFPQMIHEGMRRHFRGRERIFERFSYVLYQYTQGKHPQEIARSVSYFSDAADVEDAMYFASRIIAARINRGR